MCGASVPGGVLVLPGSTTLSTASFYDAERHAWRPAGEMQRPRLHAAAACLGDAVYVTVRCQPRRSFESEFQIFDFEFLNSESFHSSGITLSHAGRQERPESARRGRQHLG